MIAFVIESIQRLFQICLGFLDYIEGSVLTPLEIVALDSDLQITMCSFVLSST